MKNGTAKKGAAKKETPEKETPEPAQTSIPETKDSEAPDFTFNFRNAPDEKIQKAINDLSDTAELEEFRSQNGNVIAELDLDRQQRIYTMLQDRKKSFGN